MKFFRRLTAAAAAAGLFLSCAAPASAMSFFYGKTPLEYRMGALEEMIEEIRENYKDETELDDIFVGIYKGLFSSLGDPWSGYYTPDKNDDGTHYVTRNVEEVYEGIGIVIRKTETGVRIDSIVSGSPAQIAGLQSGDYILKVGTQDVTQMTSEEVAALIRGGSGSSVTLTVDRDGTAKVFEVIRQVIRTDTVSGEMLDGGIAYIKISSFAAGTGESFAEFYDGFAAQGAKGVILDLRGNGGGAIDAAVQVADHLIHEEGIISVFKRQGIVIETVHSTQDDFAKLPVVCLTDGDTASASELLAAALKERGAAALVGQNTYGKGVAQYVGSGGQGNVFRLSVYYFLTPYEHDIDGVGVAPNHAIPAASGLSKEEADEIRKGLAPINEAKKYYAGDSGLNVYGVQQRLEKMGYTVEATGIMDAATVDALKAIQSEAGVCPYGALDFCTLGIVSDRFDAWCYPKTEDAELAKALKLLR